jgi:hypothetical protein
MQFTRSIPPRQYRNYRSYREMLRQDFRYRCAYCLITEFHNGGRWNFTIDHFRPVRGLFAHPNLKSVYINLYWCCRECNERKADKWPDLQEEAAGLHWIDPCEASGNHELHWRFSADGEVQWLTPAGEYTVRTLGFGLRENLKAYWRKWYYSRCLQKTLFLIAFEKSWINNWQILSNF